MRVRKESRWYDAEAGRLLRPYTEAAGHEAEREGEGGAGTCRAPAHVGQEEAGAPDLLARISCFRGVPTDPLLGPEHRALLDACRRSPHRPLSVAEVAVTTGHPVGVVRVLLGDLRRRGHLRVTVPASSALVPHDEAVDILSEVIDGIRAL